MANFTYCELCGQVIDDERGSVATLEFLGEKFDYHAPWCARRVRQMLEDASRWALGQAGGAGVVWTLVEADPFPRSPEAVLKPRRRNRILSLCRERGINRDELAEQLGTSRGAVGRWLKSRMGHHGHPEGITPKWAKRLVIFFDLDSTADLFEKEPNADAPADEFEGVA